MENCYIVIFNNKTYSFYRLNQVAIATVLVLAISLIGTIWIASEYKQHEEKITKLREDYIEIRKLESKALVNNVINEIDFQINEVEDSLKENLSDYSNLAWRISTNIYNQYKGKMDADDLKELIISILMPLRFFDGRGYYWIHDTNHTLIAHPFRKNSIGQDDSDLTDFEGQKIVRSFVKAATDKTHDGFVIYHWSKPDVDEQYHKIIGKKKIAHLKLFEPYQWIIGIGEYVDEIEQQTKKDVIKRLSTIQHGEKGYIFGHTSNGVCISHIVETNIGKNRWKLEDANGLKVVQELNRVGLQPGGGFLNYVGSINPETGKPAQKISFIGSVNKWDWVLGSGVYIADIEEKLTQYSQELVNELMARIATTAIILIVILIIGFFIGNLFFKNLLKELDHFVGSSVDDADVMIASEKLRISELRTIAERANVLLAEKKQIQADLGRAKRMESIGIMAGGVAHDLNNILSGIIGYPELMLHKLPPESELRRPLMAILDSGKRASTVVADLLTVARSAASKKGVYDINLLIHEYLQSPEFHKLTAEHPKIVFKQDLTKDSSPISCSPVHIKKCLMNLVINAAEAIDGPGEVTVNTHIEHVNEGYLKDPVLEGGVHVCLTICDTGPGISDSDLEHIFEPFYTRKAMGKSGTGLGLTIVWNTMENHGGKIKVESGETGTCFYLNFPIVTNLEHTLINSGDTTAQLKGNNEKILVVDDEPSIRDIACQMLKELGYTVDSVSSGELAIDSVKKNQVDLLVIDMLMDPGINGRETYERIKQFSPDVRAIIASGFSESNDVQEALRIGVKGYIQKPYSMDQLGEAVKNALK